MANPAFPVIDVSPTKEFFISVITRDVTLADAINDLVDNCIDGARRLRPDGNYQGLTIEMELTDTQFTIMDNCGGIPYDVAYQYAFKFGRAAGAPSTDGSIGKFGVGMKRALFKMGSAFELQSTSENSKFKVNVDVEKWKRLTDIDGKDLWEFEFSELTTGASFPEDERGTILTVYPLHSAISEEFKLNTFANRLADSLQSSHEQSMENGLEISVNEIQLKHRLATLLVSDQVRPLKISLNYPLDPDHPDPAKDVTATIYAGISEPNLAASGWYVICNGRQVLRSDKSRVTGWDETTNEVRTPKAHYQFSRFRGYVFFESKDAESLPWNTSKSGVSSESRIYQSAKIEMIAAMRQVIDFLNKLDTESDSEDTLLQAAVEKSKPAKLFSIAPSISFVFPTGTPTSQPKSTRLSFIKPVDDVNFAKEFFEVSTAALAGGKAFEYFLAREKD